MTALVVAIAGAIRRAELAGCQHARERIGQPSLRIDVVQLSRLNERVHESSPIGVALRKGSLERSHRARSFDCSKMESNIFDRIQQLRNNCDRLCYAIYLQCIL
jgi:hypothetical protein